MSDPQTWMVCSACRKSIPFGGQHWVCSVSTCNRQRTRLVFCSVGCWDSHLSVLRHRDAWAVEARAPSRVEYEAQKSAEADDEIDVHDAPTPGPTPMPLRSMPPPPAATRRVVESAAPAPSGSVSEDDVLVVVSRMKKYIRDRSGMNTSDAVAVALSEHVRAVCDEAIRAAGADGRKTVLDRDVPRVRRS